MWLVVGWGWCPYEITAVEDVVGSGVGTLIR